MSALLLILLCISLNDSFMFALNQPPHTLYKNVSLSPPVPTASPDKDEDKEAAETTTTTKKKRGRKRRRLARLAMERELEELVLIGVSRTITLFIIPILSSSLSRSLSSLREAVLLKPSLLNCISLTSIEKWHLSEPIN